MPCPIYNNTLETFVWSRIALLFRYLCSGKFSAQKTRKCTLARSVRVHSNLECTPAWSVRVHSNLECTPAWSVRVHCNLECALAVRLAFSYYTSAISFPFIPILWVYRCESGMPLYKWRVTWNYAYSLFNTFKLSLYFRLYTRSIISSRMRMI